MAKDAPISRRDGFLLIWSAIHRPAEETGKKPFEDVRDGDRGFLEITYAKARGFFSDADGNDAEKFRPDDPLSLEAALLWLFRTRNLEGKFTEALVGRASVA